MSAFRPPTGSPHSFSLAASFYQIDLLKHNSTFTYQMRWFCLLCMVLCGCTSILDRLSTDYYAKNYIAEIEVVERDPEGHSAPSIQNVLLRNHDERVKTHTAGGWGIMGSSEFNASGSPRINHLHNLARKLGATLVVFSKEFDRREQELVKRREYQQGERITVNGTTVQLQGRWVDVVDVQTYVYHNYRATLLREGSE